MEQDDKVSDVLAENEERIHELFGGSFDIVTRRLIINGAPAFGVYADSMCDELKISKTVLTPLTDPGAFISEKNTGAQICLFAFKGADVKPLHTLRDAALAVLGGCYVIFLEDEKTAFAFGTQGYPKRPVGEPAGEQTEYGGQEGFSDNFKDSAALLRRRLKTPSLVIEQTFLGSESNTAVLFCYLSDLVDSEILKEAKNKIRSAKFSAVPGTAGLQPCLKDRGHHLFSGCGFTERPDTLAAKLTEGRIGVIVDGTPFAAIIPYLLTDYFHAPDDYLTSAAYALFIRLLRWLCFVTAVFLPGMFVAVCTFHPKMLPSDVMYDIAAAEAKTPFPLAVEAVTIHLIYEVVREAGLRMPRAVGHAVSIVGALVIGDAAVNAGLIAAPMLIVVGITTICSAVVSKLHDKIAVFRLLLIAAGGLTGFFGVFLGASFLVTQMCALSPFGVPFTAPLSPYVPKAQSDGIIRAVQDRISGNGRMIGALKF